MWWPPVLLSDYRCGCPVIHIKQESTILQHMPVIHDPWGTVGHVRRLHHATPGISTPSVSQMGGHEASESRTKQWDNPRRQSWPLGWAWTALCSEHPLRLGSILPYSLLVVSFNVMCKAHTSCSVTVWSLSCREACKFSYMLSETSLLSGHSGCLLGEYSFPVKI